MTEVGGEHLLVVGASTEHGHQVVGGSVGVVDAGEGLASLAVVLGEDLSEGGVVGFRVAESASGSGVVTGLEVEQAEGVVEFIEAGSATEELVSFGVVTFGELAQACVHLGFGSGAVEGSGFADGGLSAIVVAGGEISAKADLEGKKIGVQINTTGDTQVTEEFGDDAVDRFQNGALAVESLKNGKVDCVVIDDEVAKALVDANEGLEIIADAYSIEEYAIALKKGNTELLDKINAALEQLLEDGTIDTIMDKYIEE